MIRLGQPSNLSKYICLNVRDGFIMHQKGFMPEWRDDDLLYFKKTKRLIKILTELNISAEF